MSRAYADSFPVNGALAAPWSLLSGAASVSGNKLAFTTPPGSNPLAVVDMGLRSNGRADIDCQAVPSHVYGCALFPRVVDINNWMRVRIRSYTTTYQYYVTEYQHNTYGTEFEYTDRYWTDLWENGHTEYQVTWQTCTASGWSSYSNIGSVTGCRANAPADTPDDPQVCGFGTGQYRWVTAGCGSANGCATNACKYQQQKRTQTVTVTNNYKWVRSSYTLTAGESYTGSTRTVHDGTYYTLTSSNPYSASNPGKTTTGGAADFYANTNLTSGSNYWATSKAHVNDLATGASRQVVVSSYWDSTFEAGAPTRQAGPYTGTNYFYGVIDVDTCTAGTITSAVAEYSTGSSTPPSLLRATLLDDALNVYLNGSGTPVITTTVAAHKTTGRYCGVGGGTSEYNATAPVFDDFSATGISSEWVHNGSVLVRVDRKVWDGTKLIGVDAHA